MRRMAVLMLLVAAPLLAPLAAQGDQGVAMEKNKFVPSDLTVRAGETVTWTNMDSIGHSVVADDGSFDSHPTCGTVGGACMKKGETYSRTFTRPGQVAYHCRIHGAAGGQGMAGTVTVT